MHYNFSFLRDCVIYNIKIYINLFHKDDVPPHPNPHIIFSKSVYPHATHPNPTLTLLLRYQLAICLFSLDVHYLPCTKHQGYMMGDTSEWEECFPFIIIIIIKKIENRQRLSQSISQKVYIYFSTQNWLCSCSITDSLVTLWLGMFEKFRSSFMLITVN